MTQKILHIRFVLESENVQLFERESRNAKIKNQIHMHCESLSRGWFSNIFLYHILPKSILRNYMPLVLFQVDILTFLSSM